MAARQERGLMDQNFDEQVGRGIYYILFGLWSLYLAIAAGLLRLIEWSGRMLQNYVWPFIKKYGPRAARGAVSVSIVSVNYTTIALATLLGGIRERI